MEDEDDETTEEDDTDDDDDNDEIRTETTNGTATTQTTRTVLMGVATMVAAKCCTGLATMVCATFLSARTFLCIRGETSRGLAVITSATAEFVLIKSIINSLMQARSRAHPFR